MTGEFVDKVTQALHLMAEILANPKPVTPVLVQAWVLVLSEAGMPAEDVSGVTARVLQQATYFPTPADFLKAWKPPVDEDSAAELAWQRTLSCVRKVGRYGSLTAEDLEGDTAALWSISRVGWERMCRELDEENRAIWRAEFVRIYKLTRREQAELHYLPGQHEVENLLRGRDASPILCGRPDWRSLPASRQAADAAGELPLPVRELAASVLLVGKSFSEGGEGE